MHLFLVVVQGLEVNPVTHHAVASVPFPLVALSKVVAPPFQGTLALLMLLTTAAGILTTMLALAL